MKRMTIFKLLGNLDDFSMMVLPPIGWFSIGYPAIWYECCIEMLCCYFQVS